MHLDVVKVSSFEYVDRGDSIQWHTLRHDFQLDFEYMQIKSINRFYKSLSELLMLSCSMGRSFSATACLGSLRQRKMLVYRLHLKLSLQFASEKIKLWLLFGHSPVIILNISGSWRECHLFRQASPDAFTPSHLSHFLSSAVRFCYQLLMSYRFSINFQINPSACITFAWCD